ncbi:TPA: hypothetical protein JAX15_004603 [Enterobacter roggenkampii]|nr:hypothetical protein [Enterobacter roggenkampii]HAT7722956.1 hypothetical protein [Enterobacter roggenkampii]
MALTLLTANNAQTVLAAGISASATSLTVNSGTGALFPAVTSGVSFFKLTLVDAATGQLLEIVHVTARTGDSMTIVRAQEGTTARAWSANDIAANMLTAGTIALLAPLDSPSLTGTPTVPTAAAGTSTTQAASTEFVATAKGRLLSIRIFTSTGSYTPSAGVKNQKITLVGGGGGGGYAGGSNIGSGGGGGAVAVKLMNITSATTITVGGGGTGGTSTVAATNGGASSVSTISAGGGLAGAFNSSSAGAGGTATNGDVNISGGYGSGGIIIGSSYLGGPGGQCPGYGALPGYVIGPGNGVSGSGYGAGGGGGTNSGNGADGRPGIVIIEEYS